MTSRKTPGQTEQKLESLLRITSEQSAYGPLSRSRENKHQIELFNKSGWHKWKCHKLTEDGKYVAQQVLLWWSWLETFPGSYV